MEDTFSLIRQMKKEGVTPVELTQAKRELRAEVILGNESPQARMDNLAKSVLCYGRVISRRRRWQALHGDRGGYFCFYGAVGRRGTGIGVHYGQLRGLRD